jgi:hypothetical protein
MAGIVVLLAPALFFEILPDHGALLRRQPVRIGGPVLQPEEGHNAQKDCWNAFQQKQPLPAVESADAIERAHDPAG